MLDPDVNSEVGTLGRAILRFEKRLSTKRDGLRDRELAILAEFSSLVRTLDGAFEVPQSCEFLAWLDAREAALRTTAAAQAGAGAATSAASSVAASGPAAKAAAAAAARRATAKTLLMESVAQLDTAVAHRSLLLGRTRPPGSYTEEEMVEARLAVWLSFLRHYAAYLSTALDKGRLEASFDAAAAATALRETLGAPIEARLATQLRIFDANSDGWLTDVEAGSAMEAITEPTQRAIESVYQRIGGLDKRARGAMPKALKWAAWDSLELPVKTRCAFAWAAEDQQRSTGPAPTDREATPAGISASAAEHFPELKSVAADLARELEDARWRLHDERRRFHRAVIYGAALYLATVAADTLVQLL